MNIEKIKQYDQPPHERDVGRSLTMAMDMFNTSAQALADHVGISRAYLYKIKEQKSVNTERLDKIASFYNLTGDQFLDLPAHPLTTAFDSVSNSIIEYLKAEKPKYGKYIAEVDRFTREVSRIITMLEKS